MTASFRKKLITLCSSPWFSFGIFCLANILLSHFPMTWKLKLEIGIMGILLPFLLLLRANHTLQPEEPNHPKGALDFQLPSVFWVLVLCGAVFVRFYRLTTLSTWPFVDEGYSGFFAVELSEKWSWHLLYSYCQFPPLHFWLLGLFFKLLGPSLKSLWLYPALLSLLAIPLVYLASRHFFSKSLSLTMTAFWLFGYWPLFLGRLCLAQGLLVLWQLATFLWLGHFLRQTNPQIKKWNGFILGTFIGTGFYVHLHWPVMALWTSLIVCCHLFQKIFRQPQLFLYFLIPTILLPLPLLMAFRNGEHASYLHYLFIFNGNTSWPVQLRIWWSYLSALFWGVEPKEFVFNPVWGGYLNPIAGALFFLGFAEICREIKKRENFFLLLGFVLLTAPALLTRDFEMLRMTLVLPLVVTLSALGAMKLILGLPSPSSKIIWVVLLILMAGLDFYHLEGPYQARWHSVEITSNRPSKLLERWRAYQILSSMYKKSGPGLILMEFDRTPFDQTLTTALYPFNAARNPSLSPLQVQWAGLLTNINYAPFLAKRFPNSKWFPLPDNSDPSQSTLVLGILPMDPVNQKIVDHWLVVEQALRMETSQLLQLPINQTNPKLTQNLYSILPLADKDPFLESCIGEKIFYSEMTNSNSPGVLTALRRALTLGYPSANLYNDLGVYWFTAGNALNARKAFEAALHSPLHHTNAGVNLQMIPNP
jgi:hypothetical protein